MSVPKITSISISAKCSDLCYVGFKNQDGETIGERDGYVPNFMPGEHYGDYVMLDINIATGQITNWRAPSQTELQKAMKGE